MVEAGFFETRRFSPGGVAVVVALHAGVIAALIAAKMEVPVPHFTRTHIDWIDPIKDPDPVPPKSQDRPHPRQPQHESHVDQVKPIVETKAEDTSTFDPGPLTHEPPISTPVGPIDVPPPPLPPVIERAAAAKGDVRALITNDDYPSAALRNEEQGSLRAKLVIGANGRVSDCAIVQSSGSQALDNTTCRILKSRARFTPAVDSNGLPTTGAYTTPVITWQLQG